LTCGAGNVRLGYITLADVAVGSGSGLRKRSNGDLGGSSGSEAGDGHGDDTGGRGDSGSGRRTLSEDTVKVNLLRHRASSSVGRQTSEESSPERHCCCG